MHELLPPQAIDQYLGKRLRQRRLACGLTQVELAKKIGVTVQQVHKYEKGMDRLSASRLIQLAYYLAVPVTFFYHELMTPDQLPKKVVIDWENVKGNQFTIQFVDEEKIISNICIKGE